jgi:PAS domain S-box-containing protein
VSTLNVDSNARSLTESQLQARLRESDDQLHEARLRYQALIEQIPVLTYTASLDDKPKLLYISPQVQDWLGYSPQECMAVPDWWALVTHPDDLARTIRSTWRSNPEATKASSEYRLVTRTGHVLWVRDDVRAARDEHGRALFVQGVITDITERKLSQDEMNISLAREHELNELKTRFITTVSHEFRTPLSRILSAAELIERSGEKITPDKRSRYVDQIRNSITFIADMLQEVLLVDNYEAGITPIDARPIDLEQFCTELVQQMQMSLGRRCRLIYDSHGDCLSARMDIRILKQILSNLLNNAIRYSTQPDPTVEFTLDCDGTRAIFSIADHGIGIPDEDQPHIFDAFHRGSNVSLIAGTGLGLAIVRNGVQAHRGDISFQSELGKGTTFTVSLPLR